MRAEDRPHWRYEDSSKAVWVSERFGRLLPR